MDRRGDGILERAPRVLVDALKERGHLENTWIVVVADHGELLGENGMYAHGRTLFESMIHVPMLIRPPTGVALPDQPTERMRSNLRALGYIE